MQCIVNGKLVDQANANISVMDTGFQHSIGLFETCFSYNGVIFLFNDHLMRLKQSCQDLGIHPNLDIQSIADNTEKLLKANQIDQGRIRITVTAGDYMTNHSSLSSGAQLNNNIIITAIENMPFEPIHFEKGILVNVHGPAANPFEHTCGYKTLNYWPRLTALRNAAKLGAAESIWLNISNHLASGCISNIFLVKDDDLLTPFARGEEDQGMIPAPVLPGVTRNLVFSVAKKLNIKVQKKC